MKQLLALARSTQFAVMLGNVGVMGVSLLTGVVCARWLGPEGRGQYVGTFAYAAFLGVVLTFGVSQSVVLDRGEMKRLMQPLVAHVVGAMLVGTACGLIFRIMVHPWLSVAGIVAVGLIAAGGVASGVAAGLSQRNGDLRGGFQATRILPPAVSLLGMISLVVSGVRSPNVWLFVSGLTIFVSGTLLLVRSFRDRNTETGNSWKYDARFVRISFAAYGVALTTQFAYRIDSLVSVAVLPTKQVAMYAIAVSASSASGAIAQASGMVTFSRMRTLRSYHDRLSEVRASSVRAIAAATAGALPISILASPLVMLVYGADFSDAVAPMTVLVWIAIPMSIDYLSSHALMSIGRSGLVSCVRVVMALAGVAALIAAGRGFGSSGLAVAALGTMCCSAVVLLVSLRIALSQQSRRIESLEAEEAEEADEAVQS